MPLTKTLLKRAIKLKNDLQDCSCSIMIHPTTSKELKMVEKNVTELGLCFLDEHNPKWIHATNESPYFLVFECGTRGNVTIFHYKRGKNGA